MRGDQRFNEIKRGQTSVFDEESPGPPIEVSTNDVDKMHDVVMEGNQIKDHKFIILSKSPQSVSIIYPQ